VQRIEQRVGDRIEIGPFQEIGERFPDIPRTQYERSVQFISCDGTVRVGAEAIFCALAVSGAGAGLWWYRHCPGWAQICELVYGMVASHRPLMSRWTRRLIGPDLLPSRFLITRWVFLRLLGVVGLCAFLSMWVQMDGLLLRKGIAPAADLVAAVRTYADEQGWSSWHRWFEFPTLAWFSASDGALTALATIGVGASVLLILDCAPGMAIAIMWVCYLSLVQVGGVFFQFQWDALLLETLFLSLFFTPWRVYPRLSTDRDPPLVGVWLLRLLLAKLMFLSGAVKLLAHDDTWTSLRALDVHFFTQPLPNVPAYYAHQLPHVVHAAAILVTLFIELCMPLLVFGPRRLRIAFGMATMFLMTMISLTGNYGFFNVLTFSLAVVCYDDAALRRFVPRSWRRFLPTSPSPGARPSGCWKWRSRALWAIAALILLASAAHSYRRLVRKSQLGAGLIRLSAPFVSVNAYGLFQDMTLERPEIIVEGSRDGNEWHAYEFRYKPGDPARRPAFVGPHMPRLDWQMWFAALGGCRSARWFPAFEAALLEGKPEVRSLLLSDPFGDEPPRYLRTTVYDYQFAETDEPGWWRRTPQGTFCPPLSELE
jgi:hypothetical protein